MADHLHVTSQAGGNQLWCYDCEDTIVHIGKKHKHTGTKKDYSMTARTSNSILNLLGAIKAVFILQEA